MQPKNLHSLSMYGSHSFWVQSVCSALPACPIHREADVHRISYQWVLCLRGLRPGTCGMLGGWGGLRSYVGAQPTASPPSHAPSHRFFHRFFPLLESLDHRYTPEPQVKLSSLSTAAAGTLRSSSASASCCKHAQGLLQLLLMSKMVSTISHLGAGCHCGEAGIRNMPPLLPLGL